MGRFAHEGVVFGPIRNGQPVVAYSGDDARFEYIYKFVSRRRYYKKGNNRNLLNSGRLFVAKFSDDGSGEWIELRYGKNGLTPENGFSSQADVLVNTRTAADFVGATRMDRPEWAAVHPENGEVYFTLTNNSRRAADDVDAANPRGPNATGHIIRWREKGNRPWAKKFNWDIFLIAGDPREDATVTLDEEDRFASPDGLWFDYRGVLWIQTDMSGSQQFEGPFGNNQMLAVDPDNMDIRRFLIGPTGCEVTGVHTTPDGETLFCNMQHPGEGSSGADPSTNWPGGPGERPRSSTVIVTKDGGGVVGT
jgi:secreted PhoX family phosphatase